MKRTGAPPPLVVTVRPDKILLRGFEAERAARFVSDDAGPRWSDRGRGWVLDSEYLPDVLAYAQGARTFVVLSEDRPAGAA